MLSSLGELGSRKSETMVGMSACSGRGAADPASLGARGPRPCRAHDDFFGEQPPLEVQSASVEMSCVIRVSVSLAGRGRSKRR